MEFIIHTMGEAEEAVANILNEAGANGVVIEDIRDVTKEKPNKFGEVYEIDSKDYPKEGIRMKAYFPDNREWDGKKQEILGRIHKLNHYNLGTDNLQIAENTVREQNWANEWKKYFKIQKVTDQIIIIPKWENYSPHQGELPIYIDPGMAFGTGTHPTTILSIKALETYVKPGDLVLDVGAGSGILSITACLLGAKHVYAFDLDEISVQSTKNNRDLNHLRNKITVKQHDLLRGVDQQANIIVSNILAEVLLHLIEDARANLIAGGYFITSGIIESKKQAVLDKLTETGFSVIDIMQEGHWISITAKKERS